MASVYVYDISSTGFSVRLTELQTEGVDYTRKCQWTVREKSSNNTVSSVIEYITQGETEGIAHTFSSLSANTDYVVSCTVYNNDTEAYLNTFSEDVTTNSSGSGGGNEETQIWTVYDAGSRTDLEGEAQTQLIFSSYRISRFAVSFKYSGTAVFYTTGNAVDTRGYLTTSAVLDSVNGKPDSLVLAEADSYEDDFGADDGLNFSITYPVTADTTYYIWVREYYGTGTGTAVLHIMSPDEDAGGDDEDWHLSDMGSFDIADAPSLYMSPKRLYRYSTEVDKNGKMSVVVVNQNLNNICLYVTTGTSRDENTGRPYNIIAEAEGSGTAVGVQFDVSADTTYYIWFGVTTDTTMGSAITYLMCSLKAQTILNWNWFASNGIADEAVTTAAYNAITGTGLARNTLNFSHLVWHDIVNIVDDEIVENSTKHWDTDYATAYHTKFHSTKCEFTAVMFNSLRNNLELAGLELGLEKIPNATDPDNAVEGTIPHPVNSGDPVYGHYFLTLTDYMNACIDKINGL